MSSRRGSALLIVLGMLAFMVVSAVAFSAYMRYSRMPSSYLRRTVASRMLVKAALANAIDEIDAAIGNNIHPGVGTKQYKYPRQSGNAYNRNLWLGRTYVGPEKSVTAPQNALISQSKTVSTLTLEGLAYIPPPLVNDVRYYSRRANSATWHNLDFDSGRYAFTAVDVSDYFDVNALYANKARSSNPGERISLAYLFENSAHTSYQSSPASWDDSFMKNFRGDGKIPLISVADINLAINNYQPAGWTSPFCNYVDPGTYDNFYNSASGEAADRIRRMTFVSDGWFPNVSTNDPNFDLTMHQPLTGLESDSDDNSQHNVKQILSLPGAAYDQLADHVSGLDLVSLWDYLDENNVPVSLALPTTERVPMLVGMQPEISLRLNPKAENPVLDPAEPPSDGNTWTYTETKQYRLEIKNNAAIIGALFAYPFLRDKAANKSSFTTEFALRIGFVDSGASPKSRVNANNCGFVVSDESDFAASGNPKFGVLKANCTGPTLSYSGKEVTSEQDAVETRNVNNVDISGIVNWSQGEGGIMFWTKDEVTKTKDPDTGAWTETSRKTVDSGINENVYPLAADLTSMANGWNKEALLNSQNPVSISVRPYLVITARIKKGNKTVDLVPASSLDDDKYNGISQDQVFGNLNYGSGDFPIMLFPGDQTITFGQDGFSGNNGVTVTFKPSVNGNSQCVFCPDPRWNFAPENFFQSSQPLDTIAGYYKNASDSAKIGVGVDGRDGDIFMGVSNQGFLQSISELAYLPRTSLDFGGGDEVFGNARAYLANKLGQNFPVYNDSNFDDLAHGKLMWRTYRLYPMNGLSRDPIFEMGFYNGDTGFKINPYTESTNIVMAAIANTPDSWWAASTNNVDITDNDLKVENFNQKYAFNEINSKTDIKWSDFMAVAGNMMTSMRASGLAGKGWEHGFLNMDWAGINSDFCGVTSQDLGDALYEVDRKMLCGFWHDCFAVKQQLFLVFVRAEPAMMGGGGLGQMPPQLGARAVALVWRDPTPSTEDIGDQPRPHKTRVLFYRQFD